MFNNCELDAIYEKVQDFRDIIKNNESMMNYYYYLKNINKNDNLYGWMFSGDAIMNDQPDDLDLYQTAYIRDILTVYKNELENIIIKNNL